MYILGINAAFHDSAACLLLDGKIVAAAEDERFTGIKHAKRPVPFSAYELPYHAIHYCLREAGIHLRDVSDIAYSFLPDIFPKHFEHNGHVRIPFQQDFAPEKKALGMSVWDPLFYLYIQKAPNFLTDAVPYHLAERFRPLSKDSVPSWHFVDHHMSHAASCFLVSPFPEAAILVIDGRGERASTTYAHGIGGKIDILGDIPVAHSLGLLYEKITTHLGFLHSSDEYKVMALASYGKPVYKDIFNRMIQVHENGQVRIDYPDLVQSLGAPRLRKDPIQQCHFDIARSLQEALEEQVFKMAHYLHQRTGSEHLCLAGGVALNCVMNGRLQRDGPFKKIWIQPAAGDAGTALGAALHVHQAVHAGERPPEMTHVYWGPGPDGKDEIENYLEQINIPYRRLSNVAKDTARLLAKNRIIGWFQGRMEFGPRALGARSIIASPLSAEMRTRLNIIKDREMFRPVAPSVLEDRAEEWFCDARPSPFMMFVYKVRPDKVKTIPAVTHVDNSARVQTVNRKDHPLYYDLIKAFGDLTGVPIIINTSFNRLGKPIVCTPRDALDCFFTSPLDDLVIGDYLVSKKQMSAGEDLRRSRRREMDKEEQAYGIRRHSHVPT